MARTKGFDAEAAVTAARDVFWERGYVATSVTQLQAATGLSKSSLYETFGSKRQLFRLATDDYLAHVIDPLIAPLERAGAGAPEVAAWFRAFGAHFRDAPERIATRGCLVLNTSTELHDLDDDATATVLAFRLRVRAAFANAVRGMTVDDPARHAELLTVAHLGLITTSRMDRDLAATLAETLALEALRHS